MDKPQSSREAILADVRAALAGCASSPLQPLPASARFEPRKAATLVEEMEMMLREVERLSGHGRRVRGRDEFAAALDQMVGTEGIRTAAFSGHPLYRPYGISELLKGFGVRILSPDGDGRGLAECDLGITVADAAIPETGSVLLRTTQGQHDILSLLPRVHLALVQPSAFLADLHQAFALAGRDRHFVLVSGSSRTADIEKVLTLGVHGPKSFHVWICD
jgi:L-lactate dehydrogenase complex protein LldG